MKKFIYTAIVAMLATACIYPYNPVTSSVTTERLVVEGDILIGSTTDVMVSYVMPLDGNTNAVQPECEVAVESSDGGIYKAVREVEKVTDRQSIIHYKADTKNLSTKNQYRLYVKNTETGKKYHSSWENVQFAPKIDSLGYIISDDRKSMDITISLTADEDQKYYRWTFLEEWEYTSLHRATVYCVPGDMYSKNPKDTVAQVLYFDPGQNNYYCWNYNTSDGILLGTSEGLNTNKLVDHRFAAISYHDLKIQSLYRMTVTLQSISQDGYDYWSNLDVISNLSGSFDSPNPSVMAGNISNDDDPNEFVIGFVNVSGVTTYRRYISDSEIHLYDWDPVYDESDPQEVPENMWNTFYYNQYYRPYSKDMVSPGVFTYMWDHARCVDCTLRGGSKEKRPADWPNDHY